MKKQFALLFTLLTILIVYVACGVGGADDAATVVPDAGAQEAGAQVVAPANGERERLTLEFQAWYPVHMNDDDAVVAYIEERFNVDLNLTIMDWQPNIDNIAMRVAVGDYPNVWLMPYFWVAGLGSQFRDLIEDDLLVNVSQFSVAGGFTNIQHELSRADAWGMRAIYADEHGDYWALPRDDGFANPGIFVRRDWLDQLGLDMPRTLEELEEALAQMVEADLDGVGHVEGLVFAGGGWLGHFIVNFTGIHTSGWFQEANGDWNFHIFHPGFQEGLRFLNRLHYRGLLDPEFLAMSTANARDKFLSGRAAMIIHNANGIDYIDFLVRPMAEYREDAEVGLIVPWPAGPSNMRNGSNPYGSMAVIFDKDPEANHRVFEILDFILSPEGTHLTLEGIEGIHYTLDNGNIVRNEDRWQHDFHGIEHHFMRHFAFPGVTKDNLIYPLDTNIDDIAARGVPPAIVGLHTDTTAWLAPNLESVFVRWRNDFVVGAACIDTEFQDFLDEYIATGFYQMLDEVRAIAATR